MGSVFFLNITPQKSDSLDLCFSALHQVLLVLLIWCTVYNFGWFLWHSTMAYSRGALVSFVSAYKHPDPLLSIFETVSSSKQFLIGKEAAFSSQKSLWYFTMLRHNLIPWMLTSTFILPTENNYQLYKPLYMLHGRALFWWLGFPLVVVSSVAWDQFSFMVKRCS